MNAIHVINFISMQEHVIQSMNAMLYSAILKKMFRRSLFWEVLGALRRAFGGALRRAFVSSLPSLHIMCILDFLEFPHK
jgi:hypothetical protein